MAATCLICGPTGLVGREVVQRVMSGSSYAKIILVARRPLEEWTGAPRLEQVIVDFAHIAHWAPQLECDHVFCAFGTTLRKAGSKTRFRAVDFDYPRTLAAAVRQRGARHLSLVSARGAYPQSRIFYSRVKGELEEAVREQGWPSLVMLRPSVLGGRRSERRPAERLGQLLLAWAPKTIRTIPAGTVADAMVRLAADEPPGVTILESRDIWRAAGANPRRPGATTSHEEGNACV